MNALKQMGEEAFFAYWRECLPVGCPSHEEIPYAFKACALQEMIELGYDTLLWIDSSIIPVRPLGSLWELIERQGYWFSENPPYGMAPARSYDCGQWTCDSALPILGLREELFKVPQVIGTAFGLCLEHSIAQKFQIELLRMAKDGRAFCGPWSNENGQASADKRVLGHRHDQTVMSVLAYRLGMELTKPPQWIVDGVTPTEETFLQICR
jgi:hypothetical protein